MHSHRVEIIAPSVRRVRTGGTVVAPHEHSVQAGLEMYELGGNAVDAAVAAALVSGVIEPAETTLAGSGFALSSFGDEVSVVDFGPMAPLKAYPTMFELVHRGELGGGAVLGVGNVVDAANTDGPRASGVPRTLGGLIALQQQEGTLDLGTVFAPAIEAAEDGFRPDSWHVAATTMNATRLGKDPTAAATFLAADGTAIGADSMIQGGLSLASPSSLTQPLLAETFRRIVSEGPHAWTTGSVARDLCLTAAERGMLLTEDDFRRGAAVISRARGFRYRDAEVYTSPIPSGGPTVLEFLAVWQRIFPEGSREVAASRRTLMLGLALGHVFADRYHWLGDDATVDVPLDALLSETYATELAAMCLRTEPVDEGVPEPWATYAVSQPHADISIPRSPWTAEGGVEPTTGTTTISAADDSGRTVAITHTAANMFGSGVMCARTGLLFDAAMGWFNPMPGAANSIRPGARALANMAPTIVRTPETTTAVGASGGRRIPSAIAQIVVSLVDGGMSIADALKVPRVDGSGGVVIAHENADVSELQAVVRTQVVPAGNTGFSIDFARANGASFGPEGLESAIDMNAFGF